MASSGGPGEFPTFKNGRYVVVRALGAGGQGQVYEAEDKELGRRVAMKLLHGGKDADKNDRERFAREARILAALKHPNIPAIIDVTETDDGDPAIVMEYVYGRTVHERLRTSPAVTLVEALSIASQVAEALAAAHAEQMIHRDLKPSNIIIGAGYLVKLVDWGFAYGPDSRVRASSDATDITGKNEIIGTEGYISPEQMRGERATSKSDVFLLGCVLYELLTGEMAFPLAGRFRPDAYAKNPDQHHSIPGVPSAVRFMLDDALMTDDARRTLSAREMADTLIRGLIEIQAGEASQRLGARAHASFTPKILDQHASRILIANPDRSSSGKDSPFVAGGVADARSQCTIHLVHFTSDDRPDLQALKDRRINERNRSFCLRLYLPKMPRTREPFDRIVVMYNGLAEASSKILDDIGMSFAADDTPAILLPLPCHLSRFVNIHEHADPFRPEKGVDKVYSQQLLQCIHAHPEWIYHAWEQLLVDTNKLLWQLRDGVGAFAGLLKPNARVSMFGYSLGGLYALGMMLEHLKLTMIRHAGDVPIPSHMDDEQRKQCLQDMPFSCLFLLESGLPIDQIETSRLYYRPERTSVVIANEFVYGPKADEFQKFAADGIGRLFDPKETEKEAAYKAECRRAAQRPVPADKQIKNLFERSDADAVKVWEYVIWKLHQATRGKDDNKLEMFRRVFMGEHPGLYKSQLDALRRRILIITGGEDEIFPAAKLLTSATRSLAIAQIPGISHWLKAGAATEWKYWQNLIVETMKEFELTAATGREG